MAGLLRANHRHHMAQMGRLRRENPPMPSTALDQQLASRQAAVAAEVTQTTAVEQARAVAEVQAAVTVARHFPRDLERATEEMRRSCGLLSMAERSLYRVPQRGEGPSVHLARELSRIWGNVQYGVHELRRDDVNGMSEVQAFAWDVETNTRSTRTFQVPHQRMVKKQRVALTDLGDVYLNNQNIGARAVRECIFTVLPVWFTDEAEKLCRNTLEHGEGEPIKDRITKAINAFGGVGVTRPQLEAKLGKAAENWDEQDVASLLVTFQSLHRGDITVEEEFGAPRPTVTADDLKAADEPAQPVDGEH